MNKIVVFDLDGTLCNTEHRKHWVSSKPKNWAAWNAGMANDTPHADIVELLDMFAARGDRIILCSGRGEETRGVTTEWLHRHGIDFNALYMRAEKDYRKDSIVKVELLEQIRKDWDDPFIWIDDRQQVVDAIRACGVRVLQVAPGDF